ncbi:MAG: hypothetical protein B7Z04_12280 [Rhodobacterales bacterium 32-66-9]|nr:MAG: hypothetical protein B7Z04_12280 [Rhodobacterales bacterium 32-66-9]
MEKRPVLIDLLEALVEAWSDTYTATDIRADVEKIILLKRARDRLLEEGLQPTETIDGFYTGVFLREQFGSTPP